MVSTICSVEAADWLLLLLSLPPPWNNVCATVQGASGPLCRRESATLLYLYSLLRQTAAERFRSSSMQEVRSAAEMMMMLDAFRRSSVLLYYTYMQQNERSFTVRAVAMRALSRHKNKIDKFRGPKQL